MGNSLDRLERRLGSLPPDSSRALRALHLGPSHAARIDKCFHSFPQLIQDVKRINSNFSKYFVHNSVIWRFQLFSKLSNQELHNAWKKDRNVIVVASTVHVHTSEAKPAAAAPAVSAPLESSHSRPPPFNPAAAADLTPAELAAFHSLNPTAASLAPAASSVSSASDSSPRHVLTLTEFYTLFLYFCDNISSIQGAFDRLHKLRTTGNANDSSSNADSDANECGICLSNQVEVVLECGHAFCRADITEWIQKDRSCPICRSSADVNDPDFEVWDLLAVSEQELEEQIHDAARFVHQFIESKPLFKSSKANEEKAPEQPALIAAGPLPGH